MSQVDAEAHDRKINKAGEFSSNSPTYRTVLAFEQSERGAYSNLNYHPVFRASAIFFVKVDSRTDTHLSFMNYWREKNSNRDVALLLTIRQASGERVYRDYLRIEEYVYQWSIRKLLGIANFVGSIELEVFSSNDLKYAFPAIEVFYETPSGISFVHSNQRTYNSLEDEDRALDLDFPQTAFDVFADSMKSTYIALINGPRASKDRYLRVCIYNSRGEAFRWSKHFHNINGYAVEYVSFAEFEGLTDFLDGDPGYCKVEVPTSGVFNRLACGVEGKEGSFLSVTHSYYDCSTHEDYFQHSSSPEGEFHCFLPVNIVEGVVTEAIFYPVFSKCQLNLSLHVFSALGELVGTIENAMEIDPSRGEMLRCDIMELLSQSDIADAASMVCLELKSATNDYPTRLTYGLNYSSGCVGSNINASVLMNEGLGKKKRSYLWGPIFIRESGENYILVSHLSKIKGCQERATFTLTLYNAYGSIVKRQFNSRNGLASNIDVGDLIHSAKSPCRMSEILWYVLESDCVDFSAVTLHVDGSGFIGGDHSF